MRTNLKNHSQEMDPDEFEEVSMAAQWFARHKRDGGLPLDEVSAFEEWLAADPVHRAEYAKIESTYALVGKLAESEVERSALRFRYSKVITAVAACLAIACLILLILKPREQHFEFSSARGEVKEFTLRDGSLIMLDTDSRLAVTLNEEERFVQFIRGRAVFDVFTDPDRPFKVETGDGLIRVLGTRFEVQSRIDGTELFVEKGKVSMRSATHSDQSQLLTAGQKSAIQIDGTLARVESFDLASFGSWRRGELVFQDLPLAEVVREMERYVEQRITVRTESLRETLISGVFRAGKLDEFFSAIRTALPVSVTIVSDEEIVIAPKTTAGF
ncbi:MAG: FecR domain-containing protein [Verrucomicrobiota bacterium]